MASAGAQVDVEAASFVATTTTAAEKAVARAAVAPFGSIEPPSVTK